MNPFAVLDEYPHMYLESLSEPRANSLRLEIAVPLPWDGGPHRPGILDRQPPPPAPYATFELYFEMYVAYAVRNESFTLTDSTEVAEGRIAVIYTESKFLHFVRQGTAGLDDPITHFGFFCSDHTIDVITVHAPSIKRLT